MWSFVFLCIVLTADAIQGGDVEFDIKQQNENVTTEGVDKSKEDLIKTGQYLKEVLSIASNVPDYVDEKIDDGVEAIPPTGIFDEGRLSKLIHKKAELRFFMKTLLAIKILMGIILPLGILVAKVVSWKALTLSLMAFMLSKILFVKNLFSGKNIFPSAPSNLPFLVTPNDVYWKRPGEVGYSWNLASN